MPYRDNGAALPILVLERAVLTAARAWDKAALPAAAAATSTRGVGLPHPLPVLFADLAEPFRFLSPVERRPGLELLQRALDQVQGGIGQGIDEFVEVRSVGHGLIVRGPGPRPKWLSAFRVLE